MIKQKINQIPESFCKQNCNAWDKRKGFCRKRVYQNETQCSHPDAWWRTQQMHKPPPPWKTYEPEESDGELD